MRFRTFVTSLMMLAFLISVFVTPTVAASKKKADAPMKGEMREEEKIGKMTGPPPLDPPTPTPPPALPVLNLTPAQLAENHQVFGYLLDEYCRLADSKDWLTCCLASLSTARLPQSKAIDRLLDDVEGNKFPISSLVSWEGVLSRAGEVTAEQHARWVQVTPKLFKKNAFAGTLRVDLLRFMATVPPDAAYKKMFGQLFNTTNSFRAEDIWVLDEMGRCLQAWKSPAVAEALLNQLRALNNAYRAEYVLHAAGCNVPWAGERCDMDYDAMWALAIRDYQVWWANEKTSWQELKSANPDSWKRLHSTVLANQVWDPRTVNINNIAFRQKMLELAKPNFSSFDVAFVVDATGSMRPAMDWLAIDIHKMMSVFNLMSNDRRIGLTLYRDPDYVFIAKTFPLRDSASRLQTELLTTPALGGGDIPESIREGLIDCARNGGWDFSRTGPKSIILVGDAPPHPETQRECENIMTELSNNKINIYVVKVMTPLGEDCKPPGQRGKLPEFDWLAKAGRGSSLTVDMSYAADFFLHFLGRVPQYDRNIKWVKIAKPPIQEPPSAKLVSQILDGCLNEQFRDRIRPLVPILLQACNPPSPVAKSALRSPLGRFRSPT